jgi:hypothetical protein
MLQKILAPVVSGNRRDPRRHVMHGATPSLMGPL